MSPVADAVAYRVGVRTSSVNLDFNEPYRTTDTLTLLPGQLINDQRWISGAGIDAEGITSALLWAARSIVRYSPVHPALILFRSGIQPPLGCSCSCCSCRMVSG